MIEPNHIVAEQFEDLPQQREAAILGTWTFLATEVLFFGGLFLGYAVYRHFYFTDFAAASRHTDLTFGTINSIILLTSSLTMALAVHSAKSGTTNLVSRYVLFTILLGISFLIIKGFEYHKDISDSLVPGQHFSSAIPLHGQVFFFFYWVMTGLHAVHLVIGLILLAVFLYLSIQKVPAFGNPHTVESVGLYWHFVDIVWLYLYPLLYLVGRHT